MKGDRYVISNGRQSYISSDFNYTTNIENAKTFVNVDAAWEFAILARDFNRTTTLNVKKVQKMLDTHENSPYIYVN